MRALRPILSLGLGLATLPALAAPGMALSFTPGPWGGGRILVTARTEQVRGEMRLDTGASGSRFARAFWNESFVARGQDRSVDFRGHAALCDEVVLPLIAVGEVGRKAYQVSRCETSAGDDLLGLDFFRGQAIVLDVPQRRLTVLSAEERDSAGMSEGKVYDEATQLMGIGVSVAGMSLFGLFDTGAELTAVDSDFIHLNPSLFEYVTTLKATAASGQKTDQDVYRLKRLVVGGFTLVDVYVLSTDFSRLRDLFGPESPFIIGMNVISRYKWTLNLQRHTWKVE